ncbi:MAG TPA: glutamate--tRNA ligase family protein [Candidatus Angelobacter sp.]|nr:glutamate--tRNA ligase family protein [Candidatus Angelobacter sp.]
MNTLSMRAYRGRLAPSPTGYLHLGHARTFWIAWQRTRTAGGKLVFRNEDLDYQRCKPEFVSAMYEDLRWVGLDWDEGPDITSQSGKSGRSADPGLPSHLGKSGQSAGSDIGGPFAPYSQSQRRSFYLEAWRKLRDGGFIYPCTCSRKDLERALSAPHEEPLPGAPLHGAPLPGAESGGEALRETCGIAALGGVPAVDDELPYPGTCREKLSTAKNFDSPAGVSWRFKVPDGETISFNDGYFGQQEFVAGRDFADFLLWRRDDIPAYQLAVVVDDAAMEITEVVRGADLLKSTARQLLLIRALGYPVPAYFHCPLLRDEKDVRLAKRHDSLSLRALRAQGADPEVLRKEFAGEIEWTRGSVKA